MSALASVPCTRVSCPCWRQQRSGESQVNRKLLPAYPAKLMKSGPDNFPTAEAQLLSVLCEGAWWRTCTMFQKSVRLRTMIIENTWSTRLLFECSPQNRLSWKTRQWHNWRFHIVRRRLGGCRGRTMFVRRTDRGGSTYVRAETLGIRSIRCTGCRLGSRCRANIDVD